MNFTYFRAYAPFKSGNDCVILTATSHHLKLDYGSAIKEVLKIL